MRKLIAAVIFYLLFSITAQNSQALPDPKATSDDLAQVTAITGNIGEAFGDVVILKDHDTSMLYVAPSARKIEAGMFSPTSDADRCDPLARMYEATYWVPTDDVEEWHTLALQGPQSAFFDMVFGNYVRYATLIDSYAQASESHLRFRQEHSGIYTEYVKTKDMFDYASKALDAKMGEINALDIAISRAAANILVFCPGEGCEKAQELLQEAKDDREANLPTLQEEYRNLARAKAGAEVAYIDAHAEWAPYMTEDLNLQEKMRTAETAYNMIANFSKTAWDNLYKVLDAEQSRVVGSASITASLYSNEVNKIRKLASQAGVESPINPLPVFDVSWGGFPAQNIVASAEMPESILPVAAGDDPDAALEEETPSTGRGMSLYRRRVDFSHILTSSLETRIASPFSTPSGQPFHHIAMVGENAMPETIRVPVTRGAYCMGKRLGEPKIYRARIGGIPRVIRSYKYQDRSGSVFSDSIAVSYRYFVAAEPINVTCKMEFENLSDFERSWGQVKAPFYSRKWDDSTLEGVLNSGVSCDVSNLSVDRLDPEREEKLERLKQALMQDVMAEFILTYGKSWEIVAGEETYASPQEREKALGNMGAAMMSLCGGNIYCQVVGLTMKTLDDIFGTNGGSTSRKEEFRGTIVREHSSRTWTIAHGQAAIDLQVLAHR